MSESSALDLADALRAATARVVAGASTARDVSELDAVDLAAGQRSVADLRALADRYAALFAAEIAHRSRPELGHSGMAQRLGFVSPVAMVQSLAGVSKQEATRLMQVGGLVAEAEFDAAGAEAGRDDRPEVPAWRRMLTASLTDGAVSVEKVEVIRRVLVDVADGAGGPEDERLVQAARDLLDAAPALTVEQLGRRSRQMRDEIDVEGIESRQRAHRDLRSVRTWWDSAGMHCGSWRLPPEDGALLADAFDQILSPRRGGPRFVDRDAAPSAEELLDETRTTEQLAADGFTDLVRLAVDADPQKVFGRRRPAVRVIVTGDDLKARATSARATASRTTSSRATPSAAAVAVLAAPTPTSSPTTPLSTAAAIPSRAADITIATGATGARPASSDATPTGIFAGRGHLEGRGDAVTFETVERHLCNVGSVSIGFDDDGQCVNVGRDQRFFTERQRIGMAVRDGGCRFPGCDRPPSYCEAHHIDLWAAEKGQTDIADGVLLRRRHHLLLHDNHWRVIRRGGTYLLRPPPDVDPTLTLIEMPSRDPVVERLRRSG